jgi:hypothetical protein
VLCLELKGSLPPRQDGPPLHVHYREHEEGTVVAGTLSAEVDGRQLQVKTRHVALVLSTGFMHNAAQRIRRRTLADIRPFTVQFR